MTPAGTVRSLWRYPVKSMLGEELDSSEIGGRGLTGDRAWALVADDGKVASAKNPRKWAKLFDCRAAFVESPRSPDALPAVRITLPDGRVVRTDDVEANRVLSDALGREATLTAVAPDAPVLEELWLDGSPDGRAVTDERFAKGSPAGTFFDFGVVHLVTTATLARLSELAPESRFDPRRFRPNLLVLTEGESGFVENAWIGRTIAVGDEVRLEVTDPCVRCVMTTLAQEDLPADAAVLRTVARHNRVVGGEHRGPDGVYAASVGVYARVAAGGVVRRGDRIRVV
ncbi:MAG: MOSC domain-containing protein [Acidobacteriota bacterium]|nr:MOSC domain-containing protein [Acidobacteriota bacterium]MDQ5871367.1 MOSC domain-containing protein [Acidobacteriota bacterium]